MPILSKGTVVSNILPQLSAFFNNYDIFGIISNLLLNKY